KQQIISIQEHNSPSTTAGTAQSANIVTDIKSLKKIFNFLSRLSVWYANCEEISKYIYVRENSKMTVVDNQLIIHFDNNKNIADSLISIVNVKAFNLENGNQIFSSIKNNNLYVINLPIIDGKNVFTINIE
ncbi:MAG: hypothetical protein DSZ03_06900, partial [Sulfurimonas sp.]